jgi:hypothetical protein
MQAFAVSNMTEDELFGTEKLQLFLGRTLFSIFNLSNLLEARGASAPLLRDVWLGHPDMQLMAARDLGGSSEGLYVASWASHNGQSHNNNDVGNFIIYAKGKPFIIDVGKPTYTRKTFSGRRYEIWAMQSAYHNLPTINGVMQNAGRRYAAKDVAYETGENFAQLKMDIASAYPNKAGINSWIRTVRLNRGKNVEVTDLFELKAPSRDITQSLMTPCTIVQNEPGKLVLKDTIEPVMMNLRYDPGKMRLQPETIDIDDGRLSEMWGPRVYRLLLTPKTQVSKDSWELEFSISN